MEWKTKSLFLFILLPLHLVAQIDFQGTVMDNMSLGPEKNVIISVYEQETVVFYTKSDVKGAYVLSIANPENKTVVFRKMGFEDYEVAFNQLKENTYLVKTSQEREFLEEVVVTAEKNYMRSKRDTTTYGADELRTAAATTIEDLIQNIPGVSVDKLTGAIRYRNREISNILIDGDNITDTNYQLISKTLGQESAKAIQVIEGYSENELLKNFDKNNKVALNLQTDENYRNRIKGSLKAGYGLTDRYDEDANLVFISKDIKAVNILGYNNIGNFSLGNVVSSKNLEINSQPLLNHNELEQVNLSGNYNKQLRLSLFNTINILENNDFTLSTNQAHNFSDNTKMKINFTYYRDKIRTSLLEDLHPYDLIDNHISSELFAANRRENFDTKLEFSKVHDEKEKILLRMQFKNRQHRTSEFGFQNNEPFSGNSEIDNPEVRFMIDYTRKINPKTALVLFNNSTISSINEVDRIKSSYNLYFLDSIQTNSVSQNSEKRVFKNNFGANYAFRITANNVLTAGLLFTNYDFRAKNLFGTDTTSMENYLQMQKIINFSPQVQWSLFSKEHSFSFLAKTNNIWNRPGSHSTDHFEITPQINYQFKRLTSRLHDIQIDILAQRSLDFYDLYGYSDIPIQENSNYFYLNNNPTHIYYLTNRLSLNGLYGFGKSGFELNANLNYDFGKRPLMDNLSFFENYYYNEVIAQDNDFKNFGVRLGVKKYLENLGTNIEVIPSYANISSEKLMDAERNTTNLHNYRFRLNIGAAISSSVHISMGSMYNYTKNIQEDMFGNFRNTYVRNFSGYLNTRLAFSNEKYIFNLQNEYVDYDTAQGFLYSSIISRYKPENSRFEFGLSFKNIFNNGSLSVRRATKDFLYEKETKVIPRLFVFTLNYIL